MKKYESIVLTVAAAMLTACSADSVLSAAGASGEEPAVLGGNALGLQCDIGEAETRAGTDIQTAAFPASSTVYVWLSNIKEETGSGLVPKTEDTPYTCTVGSDGSTLTPALPSGTTALRYPGPGSYPAAYGIKPKPASTKFSVQTDQKTESNYLASDLVYSEKKTYQQSSGTVKMQFNHLLSKIVVVLQAGDEGIKEADLTAATVKVNARPACTFNYPTQSYVSPDNIDTSVAATDITLSPQGACIIPPQGIAQDTPFIKISVNGKEREPLKIPTGGKTFEGGKQYTYTVIVYDNVWNVVLAGVTVSPWGEAVTLTQGSDYYGDGNL